MLNKDFCMCIEYCTRFKNCEQSLHASNRLQLNVYLWRQYMKNLSDLKRFRNSNLYVIIIEKGDNDSIDKIVGSMICFNGLNTTINNLLLLCALKCSEIVSYTLQFSI